MEQKTYYTQPRTRLVTIDEISECNIKGYTEFSKIFNQTCEGLILSEAAMIHKEAMKIFKASDNLGRLLSRLTHPG